jgi:hypothetical protein
MSRPELERQLRALASRHPEAHPYTLALRFQAQTGKVLTGLQVKQLLSKPVNHPASNAKL